MNLRNLNEKAVLLIAYITVFSGLAQLLAPGVVLSIVGGTADATSKHFFAIVGMFMMLFGGLMIMVLRSPTKEPLAMLFCGLQKFGAFGAVGLGVANGIFSAIALLVAFFDLFSGILIVALWRAVRTDAHD